MKKFFHLSIVLSTLIASPGFAAEPAVSTTTVRRPGVSVVQLSFQSGLITTGGHFAGHFLTGVSFGVDRTSPVRLGIETGVMFSHFVAMPILFSLGYKPVERKRGASPYIAGSIGPVISLDGGPAAADVALALLVRPGLSFRVADSLDFNTEIQFGGLTGIFYISPTIGLNVYL